MSEFYVYVHRRLTDDSIFYIGKGKGNRDRSKGGRNKMWHNIALKHGYWWERVFTTDSEQDAFEMECHLIDILRLWGPKISNITDGGEGASGVIHTDETKEKFRAAKIGRKQSPEHAEKSRTARLGKPARADSIEKTMMHRRVPIKNSAGEAFPSPSEAARVLSKRMGINASQGNISEAAKGRRNQAYGYSWKYIRDGEPGSIARVKSKKLVEMEGIATFFSCSDAARYMTEIRGKKSVTQSISSAAREGCFAYGHKWRYL